MADKNVKLYATFLGPARTQFRLIYDHKFIDFPYREPVEVSKEVAKILRERKRPYSDDPAFSITGSAEVSDTHDVSDKGES